MNPSSTEQNSPLLAEQPESRLPIAASGSRPGNTVEINMRPWISNLFSARPAGNSAARSKVLPGRRLYRPRLDALEQRVTPSTNVQTFGELSFAYTVSPTNTFFPDGTLKSTTLLTTVGITQPAGPVGTRNNLPVLSFPAGVTLNLGSGGNPSRAHASHRSAYHRPVGTCLLHERRQWPGH